MQALVTVLCPCHPCQSFCLLILIQPIIDLPDHITPSASCRQSLQASSTTTFRNCAPARFQALFSTPFLSSIDRDTTPRIRYGICCSLVSATADRCPCSTRLAICGAVDPGWPVSAFLSYSQAATEANLQAQHHPNHSFPCHKQEESVAPWAP